MDTPLASTAPDPETVAVRITKDEPTDDTSRDFTVAGLPRNQGFWLTVDHFSLYIKRTDEGLIVDAYPADAEMDEALDSLCAFDADASPEQED